MRIRLRHRRCLPRLFRLEIWLAVIMVTVGLFGCATSLPTPTRTARRQTPSTEPSTLQALSTTLPTETPAPVETPLDVKQTRQAVAEALQAQTAGKLASLFTSDIWLAEGPVGESGESISQDDALKWLNVHWGTTPRLVSAHYVEHFVKLELTTSGWKKVTPLEQGVIVFHLHRFAANGEPDAINGAWRIDTILYQ